MTASDLQAYSEPFGTLSAEAHVQNQVVQLDSLLLNKPESGQLQASGRYEIASGTYAIKADAKELKLNRIVLPQGTTISANLSVNADGSGTLENPSGVLGLSVRDLQLDEDKLDRSISTPLAVTRRGLRKRSVLWTNNKCLCQYLRPYPAEVEIRATDTDISQLPSDQLKRSRPCERNVNASGTSAISIMLASARKFRASHSTGGIAPLATKGRSTCNTRTAKSRFPRLRSEWMIPHCR